MQNPSAATAQWRASSYCGGTGACVEVAVLPNGAVAMRDGKDPKGGELHFDAAVWSAFLAEAKAGNLV